MVNTLRQYTAAVVDRYELEGPKRLAPEVLRLRAVTQRTARRTSGHTDRAALITVAAQQAALLAYMNVNMRRFADADTFAADATLLATAAADEDLLAWIKGTQSFAAYYRGRYRDAANLAVSGLRFATRNGQRIRLLSNGLARAAGNYRTTPRSIEPSAKPWTWPANLRPIRVGAQS